MSFSFTLTNNRSATHHITFSVSYSGKQLISLTVTPYHFLSAPPCLLPKQLISHTSHQLFPCLLKLTLEQLRSDKQLISHTHYHNINFYHEFYSDKQLLSHTPYQLFPCLLLEQMTDQSHTVSTFSMTFTPTNTLYQLLQ